MKTPSKCFKVDKLIRDKIPGILQANKIVVNTRVMETPEFISKLKDKLVEEAKECFETESSDELIEELTDLIEVINALCQVTGINMQQIEEKRLEKMKHKGAFDDRIFNSSV